MPTSESLQKGSLGQFGVLVSIGVYPHEGKEILRIAYRHINFLKKSFFKA